MRFSLKLLMLSIYDDCETWTETSLLEACKFGFRSFHVKTSCDAAPRARREESRTEHQLFEEKDEDDDDTVVIAVSVSGGVVVVGLVGYFVFRRSEKGALASFSETLM